MKPLILSVKKRYPHNSIIKSVIKGTIKKTFLYYLLVRFLEWCTLVLKYRMYRCLTAQYLIRVSHIYKAGSAYFIQRAKLV
jgi:hypothetical protein